MAALDMGLDRGGSSSSSSVERRKKNKRRRKWRRVTTWQYVFAQLPSLMPLMILSFCDTSLVLAFLFLRSPRIWQPRVRVCRARGVLGIGFFLVSTRPCIWQLLVWRWSC